MHLRTEQPLLQAHGSDEDQRAHHTTAGPHSTVINESDHKQLTITNNNGPWAFDFRILANNSISDIGRFSFSRYTFLEIMQVLN